MAIEAFPAGLILGIIFLILAVITSIIFLIVFWILMIVDCAKRKFKNDNERVVWILVLVFLSWLGAIIYYFSIKKPNHR